MNKKHLRFYIALFLVSMLISATMVIAYAADSQKTSTVTYTAPSPSERNTYEINIPSAIDITYGEIEKVVDFSIGDNYNLETDYVVHVDIAPSCLYKDESSDFKNYVRLIMDTNSKYYYSLALKDSDNKNIYYCTTSALENLDLATFHADSSNNTGGSLTLSYVADQSNDHSYHEAATYTGSITFDIYGQYE